MTALAFFEVILVTMIVVAVVGMIADHIKKVREDKDDDDDWWGYA